MAFALLAACKGGKDKEKDKTTPPKVAGPAVPAVKAGTVLAKDDARPPFLLLVDDTGAVRLAAAKTWADLDANTLAIAKRATKPGVVDRFVREEFAMGRDPSEGVAAWDKFSDTDIDLADLEDTAPNGAQDDPPPPPPEEDEDESGGTGTAMVLEEGKMGSKDSDRAEGQYKMQKNQDDPQLARQQAIEQARAAGILGSTALTAAPGLVGHAIPNEDGTPSRVADVAGTVVKDAKLERLSAMILIAPTAKATRLIETVRETSGAIAVLYAGKIRPLNLQFGMRDSAPPSVWLEARVSAKGLIVEAVPDKPLEVAALDQLGATIEKARAARGFEKDVPVDVLVDADVDVQHLVDTIVALDTAGVKSIGMGSALSADELARRGHRTPMTKLGQPAANGDLDKAEIRKVVKAARTKITYCYERALLAQPTLAGTVMVEFFIKPDGKVGSADASGVSPEVADCVAKTIKALVFPKPKGGGGVQVNYPFTMRQ